MKKLKNMSKIYQIQTRPHLFKSTVALARRELKQMVIIKLVEG